MRRVRLQNLMEQKVFRFDRSEFDFEMTELSNNCNAIQTASQIPHSTSEFGEQHVSSAVPSRHACDAKASSYAKAVSLSPNESEVTSSTSPSPRSEYYRLMYACLQEKFDYVQASTDRLRDRLYHVKKEVTYLKRMKRVLIRRLARYGESYSYAPLEIPDNVDIEDPSVRKRKERRERERERKEAQRAARRAQQASTEEKPPPIDSSVVSQPNMLIERNVQMDMMTAVSPCDLTSHGYIVKQWVAHCFDGYGDVFLGRCNDTTRVAIKRIPLDALDIRADIRAEDPEAHTSTLVHAKSPDRGQLLLGDLHMMKLLRHPHIVDFHAAFVDGLSLYLVLGGCSYGSVADVMMSSYQCGIPEKAIAVILRQLLEALSYLHAQRIIHRSIRASHILIGADGSVRLTGFRLARKLRYNELSTTDFDNHLESSLLWLAPEVLGQDLCGYSSKADIYSVGATLCEMANGFPPFGDMNRLEMLYEKSRGTTPRLLDATTLPSFEEPSEHSKRTFSDAFHSITGLCLKASPSNRPDANGLLSHPFLKKTKKSLLDLMPLAQKLEHVQRVSDKAVVPEEIQDVPEWVF
ncbi:unnamed protein product [Cylicocyclus nassatus]|uniref:Protein kinase domain-containing protein n=1 Tax=Cylicocyclus nassatus TaxID=53992 RepID=A0AA36M634_CYLNA|nr:unnamed protein product [Cylicocyclus nassatus]